MAEVPAFDPSKPFETVSDAPPFDPSKPYQQVQEQQNTFFNMPESDRKVSRLLPNIPHIMKGFNAFGEGFSEGLQPETLGLSKESLKWLADKNVLPKDASDYSNPMKPFMAFNEGIILPLAVAADTIARAPGAIYHGLQSLGIARGIPNDIVSIPDAFLGSPHPFGIPRAALAEPKPFVKPVDVKPIEGSPDPNLLHSVAAKTGDPLIDQILEHPVLKEVIDNPVVDDSHTIPNSLGGSTPVENPTLYRDKDFPKTMTVDGVTFDTSEPSAVHENVEEFVIDALTKSGMDQATALKVAFWDFGEVAEDAWYRAHGMDPEKVEAQYTKHLDEIASRGVEPKEKIASAANLYNGKIYRGILHSDASEEIAKDLLSGKSDKEIIDWFDRHNKEIERGFVTDTGRFLTRGEALELTGHLDAKTAVGAELHDKGVPPDLFKGTYPDGDPAKAAPGPIDKPTPEESARGRRLVENYLAGEGNPSGIVAFHASPHMFEKFDFSKIGTGEGNQSYGIGGYFAQKEGVAKEYLDKFNQRSGAEHDAVMYQVLIKADPEHFLDWDKPLSEQHEKAKAALTPLVERLFGNPDTRGVASAEMDRDPEIGHLYNALKRASGLGDNPEITPGQFEKTLRAAGIPGIKYLDQGSRVGGEGTRNFVVFDDNLVQITHVNGQPILDAARDLGVTGEPRPPLSEGKPAEAAARATGSGAGEPPGGGTGQPPQEPPQPGANPWRDRFEHFVGKLDTAEDVKQLIRESADEKGEFPAARQGDIPLAQVEGVAKAAGVDPSEINQRGLGRLLKNDAEVRTAMQLMLQTADNMKAAAREVKADASPENLIRLQETIMRRDLAVEQVVGLRAEWGRTGNAIQEFLRDVKDQEGLSNFLKDKGRTPKDLQDIADAVDALDRTGAARFMNDMRTPTAWDKFMWYWVNALISGPITHAKYFIANGVFGGYESVVVTPIAGVAGAVRRGLLGGNEGVFAGEAAARLWGMLAGTPDAIVAAAKAARTGLQTPLPGEIAQNILPKQNKALPFQQKPIGGTLGTVIGLPSRGASAIHSFFNFLGYRASMEAQAYRAAAKEGLSPTEQAFWERRQNAVDAPTKEMMDSAIEEGYRLTYINELSPELRGLTAAMRKFKVFNLVMPFMHIPFNILSRGLEGTPAAFLMKDTRADLFGKNGAIKQDMAVARLVAGSAVGAWTANLVLNDQMTGYGPTDPKERAQWIATGHQPYSVRIGDEWVSFNRFGSLGTMLGLHANLAEAIPHMKPDAEELTKALVMTVHSTGRLLEDEVGMQGLAGLIDAINDPERKGTRFVSAFAGSLLPYSSALRQTASAMDPYMRETKSVVDGLRYYIPTMRQDLLPKRDWLGEPFTNAGYGGDLPIPGVSAVIQHRGASASPIAAEMQRLDLHPAVPSDRVGGVKLPPRLYDQYQMAAGELTRQVLSNWVNQPNWYQMPEFARAEVFRRSISAARQQAGAMMMGMYPQIIQQGVQQKVDQINGVKPTKLKDAQ